MYVVESGLPIVGLNVIIALNLFAVFNSYVHMVASNTFTHRVQVRGEAVPVRQKLRRVPLAMREKVEKELDRLLEEDIIEPVDRSEWLSNVVVVKKSNGAIRLCLDLREVILYRGLRVLV